MLPHKFIFVSVYHKREILKKEIIGGQWWYPATNLGVCVGVCACEHSGRVICENDWAV